MTKEKLAATMQDKTCGQTELHEFGHLDNLIIIYCLDENHLQLKGAITKELLCYDDAEFILYRNNETIEAGNIEGVIVDAAKSGDRSELAAQEKQQTITVVRNPDEPVKISWLIESSIPHAAFDIMKDGYLFCRGIVIEKEMIR